jgi:hypothetical protein
MIANGRKVWHCQQPPCTLIVVECAARLTYAASHLLLRRSVGGDGSVECDVEFRIARRRHTFIVIGTPYRAIPFPSIEHSPRVREFADVCHSKSTVTWAISACLHLVRSVTPSCAAPKFLHIAGRPDMTNAARVVTRQAAPFTGSVESKSGSPSQTTNTIIAQSPESWLQRPMHSISRHLLRHRSNRNQDLRAKPRRCASICNSPPENSSTVSRIRGRHKNAGFAGRSDPAIFFLCSTYGATHGATVHPRSAQCGVHISLLAHPDIGLTIRPAFVGTRL